MAEAHEVERLLAAHQLVARLQVDGLVVGAGRDEVATVDGQIDAAEDVDHVPEAGEVHLDEVVDPKAGEPLEGLEDEARPAVRVGRVHLVLAVPRDVDEEVAGQREHGDAPGVRVEPQEELGVGASGVAHGGLVRADEEDGHRLVRERPLELLLGGRDGRGLRRRAGGDHVDGPVGVAHRETRRAERHGDGDEQQRLDRAAPAEREVRDHESGRGDGRGGRDRQHPRGQAAGEAGQPQRGERVAGGFTAGEQRGGDHSGRQDGQAPDQEPPEPRARALVRRRRRGGPGGSARGPGGGAGSPGGGAWSRRLLSEGVRSTLSSPAPVPPVLQFIFRIVVPRSSDDRCRRRWSGRVG